MIEELRLPVLPRLIEIKLVSRPDASLRPASYHRRGQGRHLHEM